MVIIENIFSLPLPKHGFFFLFLMEITIHNKKKIMLADSTACLELIFPFFLEVNLTRKFSETFSVY